MTPETAMRLEPAHIQSLNDTVKVHESQLTFLKAFALAMNPLNPLTWLIYTISVVLTATAVVPPDPAGRYQWHKACRYALLPCFMLAMLASYTAVVYVEL